MRENHAGPTHANEASFFTRLVRDCKNVASPAERVFTMSAVFTTAKSFPMEDTH